MAKKWIIGLAVLLLVAVAVPMAFAATNQANPVSPGPAGVQLNADQQKQLVSIYNQMLNLRKQALQVWVKAGYITQEQADARIKWMEQRYNWAKQNGFYPGMGNGRLGRGFGGPGFCGGT